MIEQAFEREYGRPPQVVASAPGRVNLLGEHTDYEDGLVLPTAIPQRTFAALTRRDDATVRAWSEGFGAAPELAIDTAAPTGTWSDYVAGCVAALRERGTSVGGFDVAIASHVPVGGGLSSSAALEIAVLRGLRALFGLDLDDLAIARLGHWAETRHVGVPVGMLDQLACSLAEVGTALFVDIATEQYERLAMPGDCELVVVDSGVVHRHADGEYRVRRAQCREAAAALGVHRLRELGLPDLPRIARLPPPLDRRARHVVTENARVLAGVAALRDGDTRRFADLFWASHASLRDDYEVSVAEVDAIVDRARHLPDVLGARMTGGGFGGAVIALARAGTGPAVARGLVDRPDRIWVDGSKP